MSYISKGLVSSVGYSFAFAALCSLAIAPQAALAVEDDSGDAASESAASASSGKRVYDAPVADSKTETVYVFANPDGSVKNTEVSTTLKNPLGETQLADSSSLTDIENAESDTYFTGEGDSMVWDAAGQDVFYTGNTDKTAPVSVKVSYYLDGKKVEPTQLAGATGRVKIRYDYDNSATVKATIKGKQETLYVPFTFITALLFDNDDVKNIEVTNGKLIDDGDRAIVAGYAIPGLQKSLGKIAEDFDIPDYFEVSADVTDFEMKSSLTIATAGLLEDFNTDDIDTSELEDASSELADAMDKILDGAGELKKGLDKLADGADSAQKAAGLLADGAGTLAKGTDALAEGLGTMKDSTSKLPEGVKALAEGSDSLADGLPDAVDGAGALAEGADALGAGLNKVKSGVDEAAGGASQLASGAADLKGGLSELKGEKGLGALKSGADKLAQGLGDAGDKLSALTDEEKGLPAAKNGVDTVNQGLGQAKTGVENAAAALTEGDTSISTLASGASGNLDTISALLQKYEDDLSEEDYQNLTALVSGVKQQVGGMDTVATQVAGGLGTVSSGLGDASEGLGQVSSGLDAAVTGVQEAAPQLAGAATGAQTIADGLGSAIEGVDKLSSGTDKLKGGLDSLGQGLGQASDGLGDADTENTLINGASQLKSGASQLKGDKDSGLTAAAGGARQLADGLATLDESVPDLIKGIGKVVKGADKVAKGSSTLAEKLGEYEEGLGALAEGTEAAAEGTGELVDGLQQFNDEGISKISDVIDEDILPFKDRLEALSNAAKSYDNFAGITEGTSGSVKFIIETDAITVGE